MGQSMIDIYEEAIQSVKELIKKEEKANGIVDMKERVIVFHLNELLREYKKEQMKTQLLKNMLIEDRKFDFERYETGIRKIDRSV